MFENDIESTGASQPADTNVAVAQPTTEQPAAQDNQAEKPLSEHLKANFEKIKEAASERDERGRWTSRSKNPDTEKTTTEAPKKQASEGESLEAPQHWAVEDRENFAKLDESTKRFVMGRFKAMEGDYTKKTQEIAEPKKFKERVSQVFAPFQAELSQHGLDEVGAIQHLVNDYRSTRQFIASFKSNPQQAVQWLAQQHGVTLGDTASGNDEYTDPQVAALRAHNQQLEQRIEHLTGTVQKIQHAPIEDQVSQFKSAADESGNPKYPRFEEVRGMMAPLILQGKTMEQAYNEVLWSHPEERPKLLEAERKKFLDDERKKQEEMRKSAEEARSKRSSFPAGTVDSRGADLSSLSLSEHLREKAKQMGL